MEIMACLDNCSQSLEHFSGKTDNNDEEQPKFLYFRFYEKKVAFCVLIVSTLILVRVYQRIFRKSKSWIDTLHGPPRLPFIGILHNLIDLSKTIGILEKWNAKYGPIYRVDGLFNERFIVLNDASHVQAILSSTHLGVVNKPERPYQTLFGEFLKNGILISKGEYWKSQRKIIARAFTYKSLQGYNDLLNRFAKRLVADLDTLFADNKSHQISELIHCCSLQIVCASVMGLDLCDGEEGKRFNDMFQRYKIISTMRATNPFYLIDFLWRLHPLSREHTKIVDTLNGTTRRIIQRLKDTKRNQTQDKEENSHDDDDAVLGMKPYRSMIDELLATDMSDEQILSEVNTVVAAGFESTSLSVHYALFLLALNQENQEACQEEIDEIFNDPEKCPDGNLTTEAISDLKYVERCCLEALRIFPVIFNYQRRTEVAVKLDDKLELPANTNVVIATMNIHRNPRYYDDPGKFDPDRFLPENCRKRHPYAFIPFSAGIRNCIGLKFAMMEMKVMTAQILRNFHVTTLDKIDDIPLLPSILITPERDYEFILKRRCIS